MTITKLALSANDNKKIILHDDINTYALVIIQIKNSILQIDKK